MLDKKIDEIFNLYRSNMGLKAGLMDVVYKFRYRGTKVVICRYQDTYNYFFALQGDVYLDYIQLPPRKERRNLALEKFEGECVNILVSKASENIDWHLQRSGIFYKIKKHAQKIGEFAAGRLHVAQHILVK